MPPAFTADDQTFRALLRAWGSSRSLIDRHLSGFGIRGAQVGVLRLLTQAEAEGRSGLTPGELSRRLLVRPPSVTGVIGRLERMKLVIRVASADDLRSKEIRLTAAGRELLREVQKHHPQLVGTLLACFSREERATLRGLMEKLGDHLHTLSDGPSHALS